jgi:hypothetical protein
LLWLITTPEKTSSATSQSASEGLVGIPHEKWTGS